MYELSERQIEDREDIIMGNLDNILKKLEEKGAEQPEIEKYKEMREWRQKRDKTVREQLEQFAIDGKHGKRRSIIDSSQLVGARIILKYFKKLQARKKRMLIARKPADKSEAEKIQARRQANVMEREVTRKKQRMTTLQPEADGNPQNQRKSSMPQIKEADNEDKDYLSDVRVQKGFKVKKVLPRLANNSTNLEGYGVEKKYKTLDNGNEEAGNLQGDEEPNMIN